MPDNREERRLVDVTELQVVTEPWEWDASRAVAQVENLFELDLQGR
ncbi:hypothetical protein ACIRU8_28945 [Streptomyces sp. NPDC101175]